MSVSIKFPPESVSIRNKDSAMLPEPTLLSGAMLVSVNQAYVLPISIVAHNSSDATLGSSASHVPFLLFIFFLHILFVLFQTFELSFASPLVSEEGSRSTPCSSVFSSVESAFSSSSVSSSFFLLANRSGKKTNNSKAIPIAMEI